MGAPCRRWPGSAWPKANPATGSDYGYGDTVETYVSALSTLAPVFQKAVAVLGKRVPPAIRLVESNHHGGLLAWTTTAETEPTVIHVKSPEKRKRLVHAWHVLFAPLTIVWTLVRSPTESPAFDARKALSDFDADSAARKESEAAFRAGSRAMVAYLHEDVARLASTRGLGDAVTLPAWMLSSIRGWADPTVAVRVAIDGREVASGNDIAVSVDAATAVEVALSTTGLASFAFE